MAKALKKRNEIAVEHTWDLEAIYKTDEKWEEEFKEIKEGFLN